MQRIFNNRTCLEATILSDGRKKVDTRMYAGSGGVLFALHRFLLLLKQEKSAGMAPEGATKMNQESVAFVKALFDMSMRRNIELTGQLEKTRDGPE